MKLNTIILILTSIVINGCAGAPLTIDPDHDKITWDDGKPFTETANSQYKLKVAPVSSADYSLIYDVEIENLSANDILVDPNDFQLSGSALAYPIRALNPEKEIRYAEESIERSKSRIGGSGFDTIESVLNSFSRIASSETAEQRQQRLEIEESQARSDQSERDNIYELRTQINTFETKYLRKNTLVSGNKLRGRIKFKTSTQPGKLQLTYLNAETLKLNYTVRK